MTKTSVAISEANGNAKLKKSKSTLSINVNELGVDFNDQSQPDPNEPGARISRLCDSTDLKVYDDMNTVYDAFQRGVGVAGDSRCLGWKPDSATPYQWMSYIDANRRATSFGAGLIGIGAKACNSTRIGVYSQNRPEYVIADQAFVRHSICGAPLYDTLGADARTFIINQADINIVVCDNNEKVTKLLTDRGTTPQLETIIVCDDVSDENKAKAKEEGVEIYAFSYVEELGEKNPVEPTLPTPDDIYILCYTSGTTGTPKGAMISHGNIISNIEGCVKSWELLGITFDTSDVHISYLPLAHAYERICEGVFLSQGCALGFFQGDVRKLLDDIQELKPTVFPCVPRLLNRLYDKVMAGVNSSRIKKFLFTKALNSKKKDIQRGVIRNNTFWDKLIFSKIQQQLGGRVKMITTGSAPLSAEVLTFLKCVVGCPIMEGYGQTECTAVATLTLLGDPEAGHVGPPLPGVSVKVVDVPEMNYWAKDNRGEVCLKGKGVIKGYLKNEEKTREAIDESGWLHTGDIGEWLPNGSLKIIDRKKHIFKLAQGEYIAPEKIENILVQSEYIAQVFVHGNSLESWLVGVVVPDPETLPSLALKLGVSGSLEELSADPVVKKAIMNDLTAVGKKNKLSSLEQVREIHLHSELFSVENGLLTPTFKSKRNELASFFSTQIDEMYERSKAAATSKL